MQSLSRKDVVHRVDTVKQVVRTQVVKDSIQTVIIGSEGQISYETFGKGEFHLELKKEGKRLSILNCLKTFNIL